MYINLFLSSDGRAVKFHLKKMNTYMYFFSFFLPANADTDGLKGNKSAFSATVITILTVSGAVVIAIVCVTVLIVVGKRRKNFPFNKNLESEIAMENPGCEAPSINNKI